MNKQTKSCTKVCDFNVNFDYDLYVGEWVAVFFFFFFLGGGGGGIDLREQRVRGGVRVSGVDLGELQPRIW
jgi:hypothetical protein